MRNLLLCLILVAALFSAGCVAIPIFGPIVNAYVTWLEGEGHAYYATDTVTAYKAVKRILDQLDHPILTDEPDEDGYYYIVAGNNDRFKIKITQIEAYITKVSIRINFMGDKPYAELIYRRLQAELEVIDYEKLKRRRHQRKG